MDKGEVVAPSCVDEDDKPIASTDTAEQTTLFVTTRAARLVEVLN